MRICALPLPAGMTRVHAARVVFDNRIPAAVVNDGATLRFRFSPRDAKVWPYVIRSDFAPPVSPWTPWSAPPEMPRSSAREVLWTRRSSA